MTIRSYVAIFYGMLALAVSVVAQADPQAGGHALAVNPDADRLVTLEEIEPGLSGRAEFDDLPAYMTEGEADLARTDDADNEPNG